LAVDVLSPPDELFEVSVLDDDDEDDESPELVDDDEDVSPFVSCPAPFGPRFFEP
jgi:hypothetical protein